jgi:hypothetical protein
VAKVAETQKEIAKLGKAMKDELLERAKHGRKIRKSENLKGVGKLNLNLTKDRVMSPKNLNQLKKSLTHEYIKKETDIEEAKFKAFH